MTATVTVTDPNATVTFHSDIGTPPEPISIKKNTPICNFPAMSAQGQVFFGWADAPTDGNILHYGDTVSADMNVYAQWGNLFPFTVPQRYSIILERTDSGIYDFRIIIGGEVAQGSFSQDGSYFRFSALGYIDSPVAYFNPALPCLPMLVNYEYAGIRAQAYNAMQEASLGSVNIPVSNVDFETVSTGYIFDKNILDYSVFAGEEIESSGIDLATAFNDLEALILQGTIPTGWTNPFTINGITWQMDIDNIEVVGSTATIPFYQVVSTVEATITYKGEVISTAEETLPVSVAYNGAEIASLESGDTVTLKTAGKKCGSDITVGSKTLKCGGKYMEDDITVEVT